MSNGDMNLTDEPCEVALTPGWWTESLTFQPASPSEKETWFRFGAKANGCLVVNGVELGPPAELANLVRDARRFRKLSAQMFGCDHMIGMSRRKDDCLLVWGDGKPLAEIADALPEAEL